MPPRPDLGPKPRLGYTDSRLERAAELRTDEAALAALAADRRAGAYVIGGDLIVIKKGAPLNDPLFTHGRSARAWAGDRDGLPRAARRRRPLRRRHCAGGGGSAEDARRICSSPTCARSRCRAWSTPSICRRSPKPRRCCTGTRATASARIAARPTQLVCGGWKRDCPACKAEHFPRTDPVVIMLAIDGERCLLGRSARVSCRPCGRAWPASSSRANRSRTRCTAKPAKKPASPAAAWSISARSPGRSRPR